MRSARNRGRILVLRDIANWQPQADNYIRGTSLEDALVSYTMQEQVGAVVIDATGNGNHSRVRPDSDSVPFVEEQAGWPAARFDGASYYDPEVHGEPWFPVDIGAVSASVWINAEAASDVGYIWDQGGNMLWRLNADGTVTYGVVGDDATEYLITSSGAVDDEAWHGLQVLYRRGEFVELWVDGVSQGRTAIPAGVELAARSFEARIGCRDFDMSAPSQASLQLWIDPSDVSKHVSATQLGCKGLQGAGVNFEPYTAGDAMRFAVLGYSNGLHMVEFYSAGSNEITQPKAIYAGTAENIPVGDRITVYALVHASQISNTSSAAPLYLRADPVASGTLETAQTDSVPRYEAQVLASAGGDYGITPGAWYLIAFDTVRTGSATYQRVYINGTLVDENTGVADSSYNAFMRAIGSIAVVDLPSSLGWSNIAEVLYYRSASWGGHGSADHDAVVAYLNSKWGVSVS